MEFSQVRMKVYGQLAHNLFVGFIAWWEDVKMATAERRFKPEPHIDPVWLLFAEAISLEREALDISTTMDDLGRLAHIERLRLDFHAGLVDLVEKLRNGMQRPPQPSPAGVQ